MDDSDLKERFESLHVPERDADYWNSFPHQVLSQLRKPDVQRVREPALFVRVGWGAGLALSCFVASFCIWQACSGPVSHVIAKQKREVRQALLQFHDNVGKVLRDEHGLHRLIEDPR